MRVPVGWWDGLFPVGAANGTDDEEAPAQPRATVAAAGKQPLRGPRTFATPAPVGPRPRDGYSAGVPDRRCRWAYPRATYINIAPERASRRALTTFDPGTRVRLPKSSEWVTVRAAVAFDGGWRLFVAHDDGTLSEHEVTATTVVEQLCEDGGADSAAVLAGLWTAWMRSATQNALPAALASMPLVPYAHQSRAVYGSLLPQPLLRFLLADEPGTGKTIMAGLWIREAQRLGFVRRVLIVCPAHLISKWIADWERFFGGELRRITADTVREGALAIPQDVWVTSLELSAINHAVREAIRPDRAGWDAVVFDEAHRLTPTAVEYHRVGRMVSRDTPRALFMTATPHRGNEWLFRSLMHLVDPTVFPEVERVDAEQPQHALKPGPLHFLRRMKEELVDYDGRSPLFKPRHARNVNVALNVDEQTFYNEALDLVARYFPRTAVGLGQMVYGKRASSSLYALAETLRRRRDKMGTQNPADAAHDADREWADEAERDLAWVTHEQSESARDEKKAIGELLDRIDSTLADPDMPVSKWPRLVDECLRPNGILPGSDGQLVVFTEFADTADWLVRRFRGHGFTAERYSGRDTHSVRDGVRARFQACEFQVIVSTDAGNEGIDLQSAHVLVNWDIPWSLVRLEQRMGRIHRVGQTEKVELYNLVALGTREGDAHAQLLENLITAANELGGKMFDSLSLVGEIVFKEDRLGSPEEVLARTYSAETSDRTAAGRAIQAITAERFRIAHQLARQQEDELAAHFGDNDVTAASAALYAERLERINPHLVERFLARLAAAGLLQAESSALADEGLWLISAASLGALPKEFDAPPGNRALIATSGAAKRDAIKGGQAAAARAVSLGPAEPPFQALVTAVGDRLRPSLWQGGTVEDPTSVTDYDLVCFETKVIEGGGRRETCWSYLARVDDVGAKRVSWELLSNLRPAARPARALHPAHAADAATAATAAVAEDAAKRREGIHAWLASAGRQLERLPGELTDDIKDRSMRLATQQRLQRAVEGRLAVLRAAATIGVGEVRRIGWAHVVGTGVPQDPTEKDSEAIAMAHVTTVLRGDGWAVADRHSERPGPGYDLEARKGRLQRCVEVKGVWHSATSAGVSITGNELAKAAILGDDYWLYVIDQCCDGAGVLYAAYRNPAVVFANAAKDVPVLHIAGSELKAAKEAQAA
jgi:superfamily II DNA or RNA helicase